MYVDKERNVFSLVDAGLELHKSSARLLVFVVGCNNRVGRGGHFHHHCWFSRWMELRNLLSRRDFYTKVT